MNGGGSSCKNCWVTFTTNKGALLLWRWRGNPNLGIISFRSTLDTSVAFCFLVGKASFHSAKVSIKTSQYLKPWKEGIWVKSVVFSWVSPMSLDLVNKRGRLDVASWIMGGVKGTGLSNCLQETFDKFPLVRSMSNFWSMCHQPSVPLIPSLSCAQCSLEVKYHV